MLIVGGTAALIAIAIYLACHSFSRWRVSMRRHRAEAITDAKHMHDVRGEFHPAPGR